MNDLFEKVQKLLQEGKSRVEIANNLPTKGLPTREEILSQVNNYNTMGELAKYFGYKDLRHPCKKAGLPLSIKELRKLI